MRNWNLTRSSAYTDTSCFQTTYEELKQYSTIIDDILMSGFQTTYEELKPRLYQPIQDLVLLPDYLWGIETSSDKADIHSSRASRLPMRNWNWCWLEANVLESGFQTTYEELKLVATKLISTLLASRLPMRNWNSWEFLMLESSIASRLPMRNWNWLHSAVKSLFACFQTTYEELKRIKQWQ